MDPKRISKKRKLPPAPSHSMIGISTRTRSQIRQSSSSHDDAELRCLIKDLRTRRVFSPKSIHADQNVGSVYMGSHGTVAAENMKDVSTVLSSTVEESRFDKNPYNDESEGVDVNGKKGSSVKSDGDGVYVGLVKAVGEVNEESVQTTPPDGKVFDDGAVNENGVRIFSPKSIHADQNVDRFYMGSHGTAAAEDMKDISTVLSSIVEESRLDKNAYNDENEEVDVNGQKGSSEKSGGDGEYVGLVKAVGDLNEENVRTVPPDAKAFGDGEVNENEGKPSNGSFQRVDKCVGEAFGANNDKKNHSISGAKSGYFK